MRRSLSRLMAAGALAALQVGAAPATAQDAASRGMLGFEADALESQLDSGVHVLIGAARIEMDGMVLTADRIAIHIAEGGGGLGGAIRAIEASGSVFISTEAQTAQGDAATYDALSDIITLTGLVVLTQGENVVRGSQLVLNLATGVSQFEGGPATGGGRVQGVFVRDEAAGGSAAP